jgi:sugar lactone lactonase YvrE
MGIDIDPVNRLLYICETGNRRVSVFSSENYAFRAKFGTAGTGPGQFHKPEVGKTVLI